MEESGQILILTGPPGSGKTTTAASLASQVGRPAVHLHADDFWRFIKSGVVAPFLPEAHRQNAVVMDVLASAAEIYARGGYFVVLDGVIGPWFLEPFRGAAVPLHYVVLRPPLADAIVRCKERGGSQLADSGPISALHAQFSSLGAFESHAIDTTGQEPAQTLSAVKAALVAGRFRLR